MIFSHGVSCRNDGHAQFVHGAYVGGEPDSNFLASATICSAELGAASAMCIKASVVPRSDSIQEHAMHSDNPLKGACTAVYYININHGFV